MLLINKAKPIHYHVHHAIFAGVLSLWFLDWDIYYIIIIHGILMGVVIEGIDFYGVQEFYLFLTNNSAPVLLFPMFMFTITIAFIFLILIMVKFI